MKSIKYLILLLLISVSNSFSQVNFLKGYFIDNNNVKTECLIKNLDWQNNPVSFEYKLSESADTNTQDILKTMEFVITDLCRYKRFNVKIDKTASDFSKLTASGTPNYVDDTVFLKYIVQGEVSLLVYTENSSMPCYFIEYGNQKIDQLFFKKYLIDETTAISNNYFRIQLMALLKNDKVSGEEIQKANYNLEDLTKLFLKFNNQSKTVNFTKKDKRDIFNLYAKLGVSHSKFNLSNSELNSSSNFDPVNSLRYGLEFEYILPISNNKWSVYIEPTYNAFKTSQDFKYINTPTVVKTINVTLDYKSIQIPIGFKYYMFLNQKSKLFFNLSFAYDLNSSSTIKSYDEYYPVDLDVETSIFFSGGFGYNYNNIFSIEAKYDRRNLSSYVYWSTDLNNLSIVLGYNIFRKTKK